MVIQWPALYKKLRIFNLLLKRCKKNHFFYFFVLTTAKYHHITPLTGREVGRL